MTRFIPIILSILIMSLCLTAKTNQAEHDILLLTDSIDATVGVCAIINSTDTIMVNGYSPMPMMSVYKFPIALAVGEKCRNNGISFNSYLHVSNSELKRDTYSPMLEKYPPTNGAEYKITLRELLEYSLKKSDNNASDILLRFVGGAHKAQEYLASIGFDNIRIVWSEDEMHSNPLRSYDNSSSAADTAKLLDYFNCKMNDPMSRDLKLIMESCDTGTDRIPASLPSKGVTIGHKTGTGFEFENGRILAVNDAAYINLDNGTHYSLSVFIKDAALSMDECVKLISRISQIVYEIAKSQDSRS